tara:strand:- start:441 stop:671 length:231 start_codon:yes stop_codon:yes gene_type:complete
MTKLGTYTLSTDDKEKHAMWLKGATINADLTDFKNWMRDIVKHGGPKMNAKPLYDNETMQRTYDVMFKYLGEYLDE